MKRTKHIPVNQEEVKTLTLDRTHIERIIDVELMKWNKFQEINRRERRWRRIGHTLRKPVITIDRKSYHWNPQGKNIERPKTLGEYSCVSMSSTICSHGQTSASTLLYCSWSCGRLGGVHSYSFFPIFLHVIVDPLWQTPTQNCLGESNKLSNTAVCIQEIKFVDITRTVKDSNWYSSVSEVCELWWHTASILGMFYFCGQSAPGGLFCIQR